MSLFNNIASAVQVKVFRSQHELNHWLELIKDVQIIDIKFSSVIIIDECVIRDCFLVIYK
ncbi:sporulation protein Cse60 [Priestia abyssalis]|uniref:sporulation protein Cse60 n=1 Tax=Priestia abyssalis TaxID=1221450 RepID=UPI00099512A2|nr:sporulation protein Cse60 [Priestia abyssalis]